MIRFEQIAGLWEDGQQRLIASEPPLRVKQELVVDAIVYQLRRRVGGRFTADELAAYYLSTGIDWCFEIALEAAPSEPDAWDLATVANAAFARYVRAAIDYGGGIRHEDEPEGQD